jgi:hypothetical protein
VILKKGVMQNYPELYLRPARIFYFPFRLSKLSEMANKKILMLCIRIVLSGWQDSNLRPPGPKPGAMTGLRYTPGGE